MSAEYVPKHGKADVAFAGAELKDAWLLLGSLFAGLVLGSFFGWLAYVGLPLLGYAATRAYIDWKSKQLPGYLAERLYRLGLGGYSAAFSRRNRLFLGDATVLNPGALGMAARLRAEAAPSAKNNSGKPAHADESPAVAVEPEQAD